MGPGRDVLQLACYGERRNNDGIRLVTSSSAAGSSAWHNAVLKYDTIQFDRSDIALELISGWSGVCAVSLARVNQTKYYWHKPLSSIDVSVRTRDQVSTLKTVKELRLSMDWIEGFSDRARCLKVGYTKNLSLIHI